jgi:hydroxymethylpyrimidine pyrophosphatase-like HAD family hydrolase
MPVNLRIRALATDYDGTIARDGVVDADTIGALERFRASGRRVILVTGRELPKLERVFPRMDLFDLVVAENGGLLYDPATKETRALAEPPPKQLLAALRARHVEPLAVGQVIVATLAACAPEVMESLDQLQLERNVILNKGSVMVLPPGIDKATGLRAALDVLQLPARTVVGVGDAENDHAFLDMCGCSVAVANALPELQRDVDWVTSRDHGAGVVELIHQVLAADRCGPAERATSGGQTSRK